MRQKRIKGFVLAKTPQYQNYRVLSPEGKLMFRTSKERADWYLSRNLAKVVENDADGAVLQLLFEPKGPGNIDDPFFEQKMENQCVVCGTLEDLTRHHIVPFCYRRLFPDDLKANASYDVMPLCVECHCAVERHAAQFKNELSKEYNAPFGEGITYNRELGSVKNAASAMLKYRDMIPLPRQEELVARMENYLGRPPHTDDIIELADANCYNFENFRTHAELLFSRLTNLEDFVFRWRKNFLETMKPQFMPNHWTWDRSIYRQSPHPKGPRPNI